MQRLVYFMSEVLFDSKVHDPLTQKLLYLILITSKKLHHYVDENSISVVTDFLLVDIVHTIGMPLVASSSRRWC